MMNKVDLLSILVFLSLISSPSYAYLDPSSGSMILQGLIGGFMAGYFVIKTYWYLFLDFFKKDKKNIKHSDTLLD